MPDLSLKPGVSLGGYPQRREPRLDALEQVLGNWFEGCGRRITSRRYSQRSVARRVGRYDEFLQGCSDSEFDELLAQLRSRLHREGLQPAPMIEAFAMIREAAARTLGKRHFDTQLYGGWLMINGMLAEMQTGEGKTLTTSLPACTAALAGIPVHVITANDYLAERDCETLLPLYRRLGLSGDAVVDGMPPERCRRGYGTDIVHTTNKQVAFDYLRDRIEIGEDTGDLRFQFRELQRRRNPRQGGALLLRGLCFAIVDEADSVLIDEASTPLIITRALPGEESHETYGDALYLASTLQAERHYEVDAKHRSVELTVAGQDSLEDQVLGLPKLWRNQRKRESLVKQALAATLFYQRDRDYIVHEEKVQIIDQSTGRRMPDRAWEQGLQQMIEAREGCVISEQREPQARISYQRFFGRYLRLGGASGTLGEVAPELRRVYGLGLRRVATHRRCRRQLLGEFVYRDLNDKKIALLNRVIAMHELGRPLLIGTGSVDESERVSEWLRQAGVEHRVLNARQDRHEAEIIARAGRMGAITVATNMAGRGTDIALGPGVEELGGLHVISLCLNDSRRVDRQLYGRSARQGDPGSAEALLSLEDAALADYYRPAVLALLRRLARTGKPLSAFISTALLRLPQKRYEARRARIRKQLTKQDQRLRRTLAFSGRFE